MIAPKLPEHSIANQTNPTGFVKVWVAMSFLEFTANEEPSLLSMLVDEFLFIAFIESTTNCHLRDDGFHNNSFLLLTR